MKTLRAIRGITLLEVMVAMFILAIGILGLAPMMTTAMYGNTFSNDVGMANALAQQEMESLLNLPSYGSMPFAAVTDSINGVYRVTKTVADNTCNASIPDGLFKITVVVSWTDHEGLSRTANYSTFKPKA